MTDETLATAVNMAAAYGLVAAVAVPVGLVASRFGKPRPMTARGAGWTGPDATVVFAATLAARMTGVLGVGLVPPFAIGFDVWRRAARTEPTPGWPPAASVALAVRTWLWLTPVVYAVFGAAVGVMLLVGVRPDEHPLTQLKRTPLEIAALFLLACVSAPFYEELGFRRVLVPWAARRRWRPWLLLLLSVGTAVVGVGTADGKTPRDLLAPLSFLAALTAGLFGLQKWKRFPKRTGSAVYATAALFALMHAGVWPSPVPLFVLALGLGWLVARTGGLTAAVTLHALFNAVAAVFQLLPSVMPPGGPPNG